MTRAGRREVNGRGLRGSVLALTFIAAVVATMASAPRAHALVTGSQEPAYTKTNGNNTYFWNWQAVTGVDENNVTRYEDYLCFCTFVNGIQQETSNGTNGPGSQNCTGSLRSSASPSSGTYGASPFTQQTVLA